MCKKFDLHALWGWGAQELGFPCNFLTYDYEDIVNYLVDLVRNNNEKERLSKSACKSRFLHT